MKLKKNSHIKFYGKVSAGLGVLLLPFILLSKDSNKWLVEANAIMQQGTDAYYQADIPRPIHFKNGNFEEPMMTSSDDWQYVPAMNDPKVLNQSTNYYVENWSVYPNFTVDPTAEFKNAIELRKDNLNFERGQFIELNTDGPTTLSQVFYTTPRSRLFYSFLYKKRVSNLEKIAVFFTYPNEMYFRPVGTGSFTSNNGLVNDIKIVKKLNAPDEWTRYTGMYIVPEGQYQTEFGIKSLSNVNENMGNLIDDVNVSTGAYLEVTKSSDVGEATSVREGDIVTYTLRLENLGEIGASRVKIRDTLGMGMSFLGSVDFQGTSGHFYYDNVSNSLDIDLDNYISGIGRDYRNFVEITYQARVEREAPEMIESRAEVNYLDNGYENLFENSFRLTSNSNIHRLFVEGRDDYKDSVLVSMNWKNFPAGKIPKSVKVGLFNGNVLYDEQVLSESNFYTYTWENLYAPVAVAAAEDITYTTATSSDADYNWRVELLETPTNYKVDYDIPRLNTWVINATYIGKEEPTTSTSETKRKEDNPSEPTFTPETTSISEPTFPTKPTETESKKETKPEKKQNKTIDSNSSTVVAPKNTVSQVKHDNISKDIVLNYVIADESKLGEGGEILRYNIYVENVGDKDINGVWIRDFMPRFTNYSSSDELGDYGVISEKEHVTWFIPTLFAGEKKELYLEVAQDYCHPLSIENEIKYKVTGATEKPYVNEPNGP